jgi:hypothetical protein
MNTVLISEVKIGLQHELPGQSTVQISRPSFGTCRGLPNDNNNQNHSFESLQKYTFGSSPSIRPDYDDKLFVVLYDVKLQPDQKRSGMASSPLKFGVQWTGACSKEKSPHIWASRLDVQSSSIHITMEPFPIGVPQSRNPSTGKRTLPHCQSALTSSQCL